MSQADVASVAFIRQPSRIEILLRDLGLCLLLAVSNALALASTDNSPNGSDDPLRRSLEAHLQGIVAHALWALSILAVMMLVVSLIHPRLDTVRRFRWIALAALLVLAEAAGMLVNSIELWTFAGAGALSFWGVIGAASDMATWALLFVGMHEFAHRRRRAAEELHEAELRRVNLEGELSASRLQILRAQVEPHFLFNSLANVRRLVRTDAAAARQMLLDVLKYLEQALPRLRQEDATLAGEVALVRSYLAVHGIRMGERLRYAIDVPADLGDLSVPPMMLLTLVENAIKHGLQPMVEGGSLRVAAHAAHRVLVLSVTDDGRGMGSGSGDGTGLANIRARLRAMYGDAASLSLHVNVPRGVVATITLPGTA